MPNAIFPLIPFTDFTLTSEELHNFGLADIDIILQTHNKRLSDFTTMPEFDSDTYNDQTNRLIFDELNYNRVVLATEFLQLMSTMTNEQRKIFDNIVGRVQQNI